MSARADRLLGERQSITVSKKFRAAKKKLGIMSRRDGFGRGGEWFWELPTTSKTKAIETALDPAAKKAAMVVYAETHPDPTIMANFLTMAETTVCKATLPSESGSEALLVSTSPEHRELACPIRHPAGRPENPQQSFPSLMKASPTGFLLRPLGIGCPAARQLRSRSFIGSIGDPHGRTVLPWRRAA